MNNTMNNTNIDISIIVPFYNAKDYIKNCLDSIFKQTFSNYEIVLINDGSTDCTEQLIEQYINNPKIRYYTQENKGVSSARNLGIKHALGKYICFVDVDDELEEDYLMNLIKPTFNDDWDLVIGGYKAINYDTNTIVEIRNAKDWECEFDNYKFVFQYSPCGKLYKKTLLIDNGICFSLKSK